ncbi:hypothetical protein FLGE108171_08680 [Flavobacterium gelidilacus]|jgi:hypothetical protein|uniref:OB-fold protein n=1 Tax=Flavobacterium gelidilacus TaxID=206041 RepID=UPI00146B6CD2|nr:hypothetical protein [Flavobacterium gelidilacus]
MNSKLKKILIVLGIVLLVGFYGYNYIMHGGARDIQLEESAFVVSSNDIKNEFTKNIDEATKKYLNKTIEISGLISNIKDSIVTIDETIFCKMISFKNVKENKDKITIKGRLVGFDDLLGEIKLDECNIKTN